MHRARGAAWRYDATHALPWVALGVALAAVATRHNGRRSYRALTMALGGAAGIAMASGPRDGLLAMPVALLVAFAVTRFTRPLSRRAGTATTVAGLLVASILTVPGVTAVTTSPVPVATTPGNPCPVDATVKHFDVLARNVDIPLNNFGDHDPLGKMYVLAEKSAAVDAEMALQKPGVGGSHVTPGLQDDPIQPLAIRANEGDCVEIAYTNTIKGTSFGLHVDGLQFEAGSSGDAVGNNPASDSRAGGTQTYRYYIPRDETLEGAHYLHPGPDFRDAVAHGLFGSLVVEPPGSQYFDPVRTPDEQSTHEAFPTRPQTSGDEAMVVPCDGAPFNLAEAPLTAADAAWCTNYAVNHPAAPQTPGAFAPQTPVPFRESVTIFHEIGDESYKIPNRESGGSLPFIDPTTDAYRPGARAVNYRSEPFIHRLDPQKGKLEALAYSSYAFGDSATPITRAYLGDPLKLRLVHGGSEMMHVYHLHSGGLHWSANPLADRNFDYGNTTVDKFPSNQRSTVLDSQYMGPGESFSVELNHGAGGPQQAVGDFTYHCHIPEHYIAGMWGVRRVFDTLQPDLWELPVDFTGTSRVSGATTRSTLNPDGTFPDSSFINAPSGIPPAVDSAEWLGLFDRNKDFGYVLRDGTQLTTQNIDQWIRPQLPTAGPPRGDQDASSMNWVVAPDPATGLPLYLGEAEWKTPFQNLQPEPFGPVSGHLGAQRIDAFSQDNLDPNRFVTAQGASRPRLLFNPCTSCSQGGSAAYPLIRTHIQQRPPFSPNGHSGAPYLGEVSTALTLDPVAGWVQQHPTAPNAPSVAPQPLAFRDNGICPFNSVYQHHVNDADPTSPFNTSADNTRHFNVVTIETPLRVTKTGVDKDGVLLTLARDPAHPDAHDKTGIQQAAATVATNPDPPTPLAIRGNVGDCVAITLTSEETDAQAFSGFAKANLHIHHVQFDPPGSDGAVVGYNYEMAVRPYQLTDHKLLAPAAAGARTLNVGPSARAETKLIDGAWIAVGEGTNDIEVRQIRHITTTAAGAAIELEVPLAKPHAAGDWAGSEFVQLRWYLDQPLDNVFFHDHTDGIHAWPHGAVGQIIVEPKGATYHDPATGQEIRSGAIADIHVADPANPKQSPPNIDKATVPCAQLDACRRLTRLAPGVVDGSFREFAVWEIDGNPVTDSTINLRADPLQDRGGDVSKLFSSATASGDPFTQLPKAYPGDPFVIRAVNISPNIDTFHIDGARALVDSRLTSGYEDGLTADGNEPDVLASPTDTIIQGPSERTTMILDGGSGAAHGFVEAGDHLYFNGLDRRIRQGAWGIIRVLPKVDGRVLQPLPAAPPVTAPPPLCPVGSPTREFHVSAVDGPAGANAAAAFVSTGAPPVRPFEPLTLHVAEGECVHVVFKNERPSSPATFHVAKLRQRLASSGVNVGVNAGDQAVPSGATRDYWYYADTEKIGTAVISDFAGDGGSTRFGKLQHGAPELSGILGLYGAMVVSPRGATFTPASGVGASVDVSVPARPDRDYRTTAGVPATLPASAYRDFTLFMADNEKQLGNDFMPYPTGVSGPALLNYANAGARGDDANSFSSLAKGDPSTPILKTVQGQRMVVHVVGAPGNDQIHLFSMGGLSFETDHYLRAHPDALHPEGRRLSSSVQTRALGPWQSFDAWVLTGVDAAGVSQSARPGDYFVGDIRRPFTQAGMWGLVRVTATKP